MVKRRWVWHVCVANGLHTLLDDIGHSMPSYPLDSTQGRVMSGVAGYHSHWKTHNVKRHAIISLILNTRMKDIECGMPLSPLDSTRSKKVGCGMTS